MRILSTWWILPQPSDCRRSESCWDEGESTPVSPDAETRSTGFREFVVTGFERHIICRRNGVGYPAAGSDEKVFLYPKL